MTQFHSDFINLTLRRNLICHENLEILPDNYRLNYTDYRVVYNLKKISSVVQVEDEGREKKVLSEPNDKIYLHCDSVEGKITQWGLGNVWSEGRKLLTNTKQLARVTHFVRHKTNTIKEIYQIFSAASPLQSRIAKFLLKPKLTKKCSKTLSTTSTFICKNGCKNWVCLI
uniref:Uncharacterized protein n=1 Tax=Micrurus surinamensis TaxID=129470 RepID=A0A2D4P568_MICSU